MINYNPEIEDIKTAIRSEEGAIIIVSDSSYKHNELLKEKILGMAEEGHKEKKIYYLDIIEDSKLFPEVNVLRDVSSFPTTLIAKYGGMENKFEGLIVRF